MNRFCTFSVAIVCFLVGVSRGDVITGNLSENHNGSSLAFDVHWVATTFSTDNQAYQLDKISAFLDTHQNSGGTLFAAVFDVDGFGQPGASLVELSIGPVSATPSEVEMTPVTPFTLDANATYFLVFGATAGSDFVNTNLTDSTNEVGPGSIGNEFWETDTINGTWGTTSGFALFMRVEGSAVPEPNTLLMLVLVSIFVRTRRNK